MARSLADFVHRWKINALSESSAAQSHFNDLCDVLDQPHPTDVDPTGERFTFEKPVSKIYGGKGYADVWLRDHFAWEYKANGKHKHKDLKAAYKQINDYREDLLNPPLLVVCDLIHFEVHTNFNLTSKRVYAFSLDDLNRNEITATCPLPPLEVLRALFGDYNVLRPERTDAFVTEEAAKVFSRLAERLEIEKRSLTDTPINTRVEIAHFLMRLLFCLFADAIGLLPDRVFRRLIASDDRFLPKKFLRKLTVLFTAMSERDGIFGEHTIRYFNGGLFDSAAVIELDLTDLDILHEVATRYNWAHVAPAIFGTLFERSLDPARRSLIGAHYTSAEDILLLIEPVVMKPLERRWAEVRQHVIEALERERPQTEADSTGTRQTRLRTTQLESDRLLAAWFDELHAIRILDPACGSGNFLFLALRRLLDLWKESRDFAAEHRMQLVANYALDHMVSPTQLFGIEIEFYAHELASIVVWIGFLQWKHEHGILEDREPILQKLSNIEHADAILRYDQAGKPYEPEWPEADFIIGNPPFLGGKLLRRELGDKYIDDLFTLYRNRVKAESDLVVYWFEKARRQLESKLVGRVGLLATQGIRGGANRAVLERITATATIFWAWSDRPWLLKGATVHVSMIAFERQAPTAPPMSFQGLSLAASGESEESPMRAPTARHITAQAEGLGPGEPDNQGLKARHISFAATLGPPATQNSVISTEASRSHREAQWRDPRISALQSPYRLDGNPVPFINPDLTTGSNTAAAHRLKENAGLCFMGTTKVGPFDIDAETARKMLAAPLNPNGRPNSDVVRPWVNALDITRRPRNMYIIDFGTDTTEQQAALYELPFEYVRHHVKPLRVENSRDTYAKRWWIHGEARGDLRNAIAPLSRYVTTPTVSKHRFFIWSQLEVVPDHQLFAFARDDDYFFGVLHSSIHELWALTMGTPTGKPAPLHPKLHLRHLPLPLATRHRTHRSRIPHRAPHRRRRPQPRPTPRQLAQPQRCRRPTPPRSRPQRPYPHQALQPAPGKAPGSPTPTTPSTRPSSPPTAGPPPSPATSSSPTCSPSITSAPPPNPSRLRRTKNEVVYTKG